MIVISLCNAAYRRDYPYENNTYNNENKFSINDKTMAGFSDLSMIYIYNFYLQYILNDIYSVKIRNLTECIFMWVIYNEYDVE